MVGSLFLGGAGVLPSTVGDEIPKRAIFNKGEIPFINHHVYLEPETSVYKKWLFQLDDSESSYRKWLEITKHPFKTVFFSSGSGEKVTGVDFCEKLTQPMDPEKTSLNFIFPTKYVIPKKLKFEYGCLGYQVVAIVKLPGSDKSRTLFLTLL